MEQTKKELEYHLKKWMVVILFIIYTIFILSGIGILAYILCSSSFLDNIMIYTIIASFSGALATCSMQYTKKLYKACIYNRIVTNAEGNEIQVLGNFVYFLLRPIFACVIVLIAIFSLKAGIIVIVNVDLFVANDRFFYVAVVMADCIGFSIGKVLDAFEEISIKKLDKWRENNNEQ